jgi:uncharacterized protein
MAEYLHPGVYIEETSFRSPPFEGVSTSTAGLVGRTRKGREGHPTLVTSFTEFVRRFGAPFPIASGTAPQLGDYLGHAVRAFFDNGGKRAYIVRTLAFDAIASSTILGLGQTYRLPPTTTVRGPSATIPLVSVRGIDQGTVLDVYSRAPNGTATLRFPVTVDAVDLARNAVTVNPPLPPGITLAPQSTFLLVNGTTLASGGPTFTAVSRGLDGDSISVQMRPSDLAPMKLVAPRFFRSNPQIAVFSGVSPDLGPVAGASFSLRQKGLGVVVRGDTIAFTNPAESVTVGAITFTGGPPSPNEVAANVTGGAGTTVNSGMILLNGRGGTAPANPIPIYALAAGEQASATTGTVTLPYGALALLHSGDEIEIGGITAELTAEPDFATKPNSFATALVDPHPATTVTITATGDIDATQFVKRLLVSDTTGLEAPFSLAAPQQISITDGTTTVLADILLVDGAKNTVIVQGAAAIPANWTSFELLEILGAGNQIPVTSTTGFYTGGIVELFDGSIGSYFTVDAVDPGSRMVTLSGAPTPILLPQDPADRKAYLRTLELDVLVYENGVLAETFGGLSWNPDPTKDSFRRYFVDRINDADNGSQLVSITYPANPTVDLTTQPTTSDGFPVALGGGSNGSPLTDIDLIGHDDGPGKRFGIEALKERTDIALVAVPGVTDESVQAALLTHCELMRYRFAILDGRPNQSDVTAIQAHRNNYDSKYGGYYAPWLKTLDLGTGNTILVPPSGHVLGICARVDTERGVHKAPANEVVRNILDVELPFTDGEQDVLNPIGVNLIREFEGRGIRVWGARTTTSDQEWKYVNVRRLFIFLEHSIDKGTQWVVFEPNNEALWDRVRESIESFLFGVWKTGALTGTKPEEAYFVRCDRTTMTQDDIDNGRLVCLIGVAPAYPAEFVIFRIGQFTATSNRA